MLDSRDWTRDERETDCMGEYAGERTFDRGEPPSVIPRLRQIGTKSCIMDGGGGGDTYTSDNAYLERFLPAACYNQLDRSPAQRINSCPDRYLFADVMALVFEGDWATPASALLGPGAITYTRRAPTVGVFSSFGIAYLGRECHIYIDGTRNREQLITQAYYGFVGPENKGNFACNTLYYDNALQVLGGVTLAGASACDRFVIIGHSYGGATAAVAAAILRDTKPAAEVAVMTCGAPRAGSSRLTEWIAAVPQLHYRRPEDPIPVLPPQLSLDVGPFGVIFNLIAALQWLIWGRYRDYDSSFVLLPNGAIETFSEVLPRDEVQRTIALQIAANIPITAYAEHAMTAYAAELRRSCVRGPGFSLCSPPLRWPNKFRLVVTIDYGIEQSFALDVDLNTVFPGGAAWRVPGAPLELLDLNPGGPGGKLILDTFLLTYLCGDEFYLMTAVITSPLQVQPVIGAQQWYMQNPFWGQFAFFPFVPPIEINVAGVMTPCTLRVVIVGDEV